MTLPAGLYDDIDTIVLANGAKFHILNPDPELIEPEVLAHALSMLCRYTGHTTRFYSVAQHCVMVSQIVPPALAMQGLMHDASEAFIGDLSRPLKVVLDSLAPGVVRDIEERIHRAIADRFGYVYRHDHRVKGADNIALATEKRDLMPAKAGDWNGLPEPLPDLIRPAPPALARLQFLHRFEEIGGEL